ncbi:MAG: outer membrane beta-barrel protein [Ignavibacteria bacterium]|nr:outer membrane beta-barrel protein [Ignavibacteria bacterium]
MKNFIYFLITSLLLTTVASFSQTITGKVIDGATSDILIGATIKVEGTKLGAVTDMDGKYEIELSPGKYNLIVSYIGFNDVHIKDVVVTKDKPTYLDITLTPTNLTTEEILIEASVTLSNEQALLVEKKNSDKITDGITSQQIKKVPDAAASDVLKRVTGLSIVKDKFVFVRGTSERYNNTTLNGALVPSTESDKKSFSFDLFPSSLLENIVVAKTFTPDQPGNFSGGLVQIRTKDFPETFTFNFSINTSYNSFTTGKEFLSYNAGEKKLLFLNLGIDNGSRELPSIIPDKPIKNSRFTNNEINEFSRAFPNNWLQTKSTAPINSGFQTSVGGVIKAGKIPFGFLAAYSYRSSFTNRDVERNLYNTDNTQLSGYTGKNSEFAVLWGGLINLNTKLGDNNKISLKSTFTLSSEDETEQYHGFFAPEQVERNLYLTRFVQRSLSSYQLIGEHYLFNKLSIDWNASYSESRRKEPDIKTMTYQREVGSNDPYFAALNYNVGNDFTGGRFYSHLTDITRGFNLNFELPIKVGIFSSDNPINAKIKFGTSLNGTNRDFYARNFGPALYMNAPINIIYQPIDKIFNPENFGDGKLFYDELTKESDRYKAFDNVYAGYIMMDLPINDFRFIVGGRYEYSEQDVSTAGFISERIYNNLLNKDILPSINIIYKLNDKTNIRAAYSQTVSRPELREIAPFSYVEFVSGITVFGNSTDLRRTLIRNYDLRYEFFPAAGELISLSLFYKKIDAPIEDVFLSTSTNKLKTFKNADKGANNYGLEIEIRKKLDFVTDYLKDFALIGNLTLVYSKVNLEGTGTVSTSQSRRMQGQSPYMVNLGLFYDNYDLGLSGNIVYNRFGDRISEVGLSGYSDIYEIGNDVIDFTISKQLKLLSNTLELKLSAKDILNQDKIFTQKINNEDKIVRKFKTGSNYSFTISYKF